MDTASLLQTLPGWRQLQSPASQVETSVRDLLARLADVFLTRPIPENLVGEEETQAWRSHYREAVRALGEAGKELSAGTEEGEERYIAQRSQWHPYIAAFSASLGYELKNIVPSVWMTQTGHSHRARTGEDI